MKRSPSPFAIEPKRPRHEDTFDYMGMDIDMNQLSMEDVYCHENADESDEELDSTVAALVAGIDQNDDGLLPMMPVNVHVFTPIEVSVAETARASQSPDRLTLSPVTEARILARCYYLKLHESAFHRLRRSQRQAMQAAGLIHIPINSTSPKVTFTREWLTRDGMADIYGPYKQYLSRKGSVTIEWIQEYVRTEIVVTNESKNNVFIDSTRLAPQNKIAMQPGETVKILTTPYEQRVILGYTLYEGHLEAPQHGLAHNCIAVLFAHPLALYPAFGMTLAGLEYRAMLTELIKNVQSSASVSQGINDGVSQRSRVEIAMEFATRATVQELCNDGCRMMHFVCHVTAMELILEDGVGGAIKLSPDDMSTILSDSSVQLAQVTSYAKNSNGHLFFLQCGIPHVIALAPSSKTDLDTTMTFTKLLHAALVSGRSIQEAFDIAQNCISFLGHATKFILYPEDADHNVVLFPPTNSPSSGVVHAIENLPPILGGVSKHFEGRIEEAQLVCKTLMNRRRPRWFSVLGPPRCGKSQFTLAVGQYISQRKVFDGGIININVPLELKYQSDNDVRSSILDVFTTLEHEMGKWQHLLVICDGYERLKLKSSLVKSLEVLLAKHQNISFLATGLTIQDVPQMPHKTDQIILSPLNLHTNASIHHDPDLETTLSVHPVDYNNVHPPTLCDDQPSLPARTLTSKPSCSLM